MCVWALTCRIKGCFDRHLFWLIVCIRKLFFLDCVGFCRCNCSHLRMGEELIPVWEVVSLLVPFEMFVRFLTVLIWFLWLVFLFCSVCHRLLCYEEHSISFQTFFVQIFKFVIVSWKFSMLLLYILWDDRPIFMISASNEQLQQQLEYTLLKPDFYSWWISKMKSAREDTLEERFAIKFCFKLGKNATKTYAMLQTDFWPSCVNRAWVFEWHKRFKEGRESVRDDERCGRSEEVNTPELIGQRVRIRVRVTMLRF